MFSDFQPELPPAARRDPLAAELRNADTADVEAVAAVRHERRGGELERHRRWAGRFIGRSLRAPEQYCFVVACAEGRVLGYATAGRFEPPPDAARNVAPSGYYLRGVVVSEAARRRGLGRKLTEARLSWIAARAGEAFYCVSSQNLASIKLHEGFGFVELTRDFWFPRIDFGRDGGILFVRRGLRP